MRVGNLIIRELVERKIKMFAGLIAVFLAIAFVSAIRSINASSERAIKNHVENLGANILIIPNDVPLTAFYSNNMGETVFPEEYAEKIFHIQSRGIKRVMPKFVYSAIIGNTKAIITGVAPEFRLGNGVFARDIHSSGIVIGSELARKLQKEKGDEITIFDHAFLVEDVLRETGTVDDIRIFIKIDVLQGLMGRGKVINEIDIVTDHTTNDYTIAANLTRLHGTKVIPVDKVTKDQISTVDVLKKYSIPLLIAALLCGGMSIANHMFINVRERKTEIGTLLAIGASPGTILHIFLGKSLLIGVIGGVAGAIFGTAISMVLVPIITGVKIVLLPQALIWYTCMAAGISILFSIIPAYQATRIDPAVVMQQEV